MVSAGVGSFLVNSALAFMAIQEQTVTIGKPGQGEEFRFLREMFDNTLFNETFGYGFRVFIEFELIHQFHADEIGWPDLYRKTAASGTAVAAEFRAEFLPGGWLVYP